MAKNWFADRLIGSVGLGVRAASRKTPIYFILQLPLHTVDKNIPWRAESNTLWTLLKCRAGYWSDFNQMLGSGGGKYIYIFKYLSFKYFEIYNIFKYLHTFQILSSSSNVLYFSVVFTSFLSFLIRQILLWFSSWSGL